MLRKIYDISPPITEDYAVFPGDTKFKLTELMSFEAGNHLDLCTMTTTTHLGAHTDAPRHYSPTGGGMGDITLSNYIGECQVIEVQTKKGERIRPSDFQVEINTPRVLFRTNSVTNHNIWEPEFCALSVELIEMLATKNVILVGIDTPSVDLSKAKDLIAHQAISKAKMSILEGIDLSKISDGKYELIALPLNLTKADASPVRAILREL
ncbi:MAG: kynurenine formamidase [Halobacteriovoraceae bacterium]|nr:kynurenine formamidase [Halobacteriovoraceae bacterium]|tara:strand:- start:8364 stop:8990 length:627 start_codon:yes stop_codon:yes gene_type:complete